MGLQANATGAVNRFQARMCLVKSFQGVQLEGYKPDTVQAYSTLFKVFLTTSAMECYIDLYSVKDKWHGMLPILEKYDPEPVMRLYRARDKGDKLHKFLHDHLDKESQQRSLQSCKEGLSNNVAMVAAAIRHIFVHGHLTAHANEMNPRAAHAIGTAVATFLFGVMDTEFTQTVEAYCAKKGIAPCRAEQEPATEADLVGTGAQ
jgi:hypothetical protein